MAESQSNQSSSATARRSQERARLEQTNKENNTKVVYALVLEHLKRATNLSVENADTERVINRKANLNYRLTK